MKKLFILLLLIPSICWAAPPTRVATYNTGDVISSTDVTANEDALFNYTQAGVDTYADLSIVNADISASANIQSEKLNLTSIAQGVNITSGGSFTNGGTTTMNGNVVIGDAIGDTLVIDSGDWTLTNATTFTLTGALTFSGTIADLGIVTTADLNGGTMDNVQVDAQTSTGMLYVNDATDDLSGLGSQGTSGQVLKSAGAGVNPTFGDPPGFMMSHNTWTSITSTSNPHYLFQMPFNATLVEVSVSAGVVDDANTNETYSMNVEEDGTTVLGSAISIPRGSIDTVYVGTITDSSIADNATIEVLFSLGGNTPILGEITVVLTFREVL